jgi:hypothetical protein
MHRLPLYLLIDFDRNEKIPAGPAASLLINPLCGIMSIATGCACTDWHNAKKHIETPVEMV